MFYIPNRKQNKEVCSTCFGVRIQAKTTSKVQLWVIWKLTKKSPKKLSKTSPNNITRTFSIKFLGPIKFSVLFLDYLNMMGYWVIAWNIKRKSNSSLDAHFLPKISILRSSSCPTREQRARTRELLWNNSIVLSALLSNLSARSGFSLRARRQACARRHARTCDKLKWGLALRFLNKALFYIPYFLI